MAYPKEREHKEYMDYVIEQQSNGQQALSKEEWKKKKMKAKEGESAPVSSILKPSSKGILKT